MPAPIVLRNLSPAPKKVPNPPDGQPVISTHPGLRDGSRVTPEPVPDGVIFVESFDDQPDWTSTMHSTQQSQKVDAGFTLPDNWYGIYQTTNWSPEKGYPDNHASLEILAANSDKARGNAGKSAVIWRESVDTTKTDWKSDSQLVRRFADVQSVYAEFYIRFSPNWWERENFGPYEAKLFRIGSFDPQGSDIFSGFQGDIGPLFLWGYKRDDYGVRNLNSFRGGPWGANYSSISGAGGSFNYTNHTAGQAPGGTDPQVPDLVNGGHLVNFSGATTHEQIFGGTEVWTKMAFYVQMNSAPGVADGVAKQWVNGQRIRNKTNVLWVGETAENNMVGWNYLAIGGNHFFDPYTDADRYEDWYAIDSLTVSTNIPDGLEVQP